MRILFDFKFAIIFSILERMWTAMVIRDAALSKISRKDDEFGWKGGAKIKEGGGIIPQGEGNKWNGNWRENY